jgi:hypothetical protein
VVEPGRCQFVNEGADIWHVSYIAVDVSGHRSLQAGPLIELRENIEKFKARRLIATRTRIKSVWYAGVLRGAALGKQHIRNRLRFRDPSLLNAEVGLGSITSF